MNLSDFAAENIAFVSWIWVQSSDTAFQQEAIASETKRWDVLHPLRQRLDRTEVSDRTFAHLLCRLIPAQCPFERDVTFMGHHLFHIPPLCKLNPLYEEVVGLRFRALCYLADQCGVDVTPYC